MAYFFEQPRRGAIPHKADSVWKVGKSILTFFILCMSSANLCAQIFVSAAVTDDTGDGTTWATAKKTLAAGIDAAGGSGVVYVMAGDYATTAEFTVPAGVTVKGGYQQISEGTDTTLRRLPGVNAHWTDNTWCTIISGAGNHRIATVNGTMEGCVVRNGHSSTIGGGLLIDGGTVRYCVIKESDAINDDDADAEGGGVYVRNNGVLINSVVTECRADNGVGVAGEDGSLTNNTITRNAPIGCGYVVDYDGNYYDGVLIGTQCWMKQNLRVTHFPDGNAIPLGTTYQNTPCYYENTALNIAKVGLLYNWYAVMNNAVSSDSRPSGVQGICPDGWHLPSHAEWVLMLSYVSSRSIYRCNDNPSYITKSLASNTGWYDYGSTCVTGWNQSTNNATRFSACPSSYWDNEFKSPSSDVRFWTSTQYNGDYAYFIGVYASWSTPENTYWYKDKGMSVRCVRDATLANLDGQTVPVVTTSAVTNVSAISATSGGNITSDGGAVVTARGICWSTTENPTVSGDHTTDGNGVGNFVSTMTGLEPNTTYYVRAYATNAVGTAYGETVTFITAGQPCPGTPTVSDYDGNQYATVLVGQQCWMKENLRTKHYSDGSAVQYKYPNGQASTQNTYGLLYDWQGVMHGANSSNGNPSFVQGICQVGWHLPSLAEWEQFATYVGGNQAYRCDNNSGYIAKALAASNGWSNYQWNSCNAGYNQATNNATGFTATPAGYWWNNNYNDFAVESDCWAATQSNNENAYRLRIRYDDAYLNSYSVSKNYWLSVRCVKDN